MSCGFLADGVRDVLGDGSQLGIRLRFVEEPDPRGTAGALKLAEPMLDERFLMLNGDVLTDIDLTAQIAAARGEPARGRRWRSCRSRTRARTALVILREDRSVSEFVEKPSSDSVESNLISAGAYVLEREILELVAPDRNVSIEREVWPRWSRPACTGSRSDSYWLDIGTPARYLQGTFDILEGNVDTAVRERLGERLAGDRRGRAGRRQGGSAGGAGARRARSPRARTWAAWWCSARDVSRGRRLDGRARGGARGRADRRALRAARLHRRGRLPRGRRHAHHRRRGARRGRASWGRTT